MPVIAIHVTEQRLFVVLRVTVVVVVAVMTMRMEVMRMEVVRMEVTRVRVHVTMMPLVVMMPTVVGVS